MSTLFELFGFDFFRNAVYASVLASISCGLIGTYIVSRRMVFISGGITHASFGGLGIGHFLGINPVMGAAVFSILSAIGIEAFAQRARMQQDSAIAVLWSLGMAIGIIFIYITPGYSPNLMSYLFGSILAVSMMDIWLLVALTMITTAGFSLFYRVIFYSAFDEEFMQVRRIPVKLMNYIMLSFVALTIVLNIRMAGVILVMSLLTIPQATVQIFTRDFKKIMVYSILTGFAGAFSGLLLAYYANIPSGATIVFVMFVFYLGGRIVRQLAGKNTGK